MAHPTTLYFLALSRSVPRKKLHDRLASTGNFVVESALNLLPFKLKQVHFETHVQSSLEKDKRKTSKNPGYRSFELCCLLSSNPSPPFRGKKYSFAQPTKRAVGFFSELHTNFAGFFWDPPPETEPIPHSILGSETSQRHSAQNLSHHLSAMVT